MSRYALAGLLGCVLGSMSLINGGCPPDPAAVDAILGTTLAEPRVDNISPTSGPAEGGTKVTIRGSEFEPGTGVLFGATVATDVTRVNDNLLEAITPPGVPGVVDVTVVAGDGQATVFTDAFEYLDSQPQQVAPQIISVLPLTGPEAGGTTVTILGAGFDASTGVLFGGQAAGSVNVINANLLEVITPPGTAGSVDVSVIASDGQVIVLSNAFQYVAPPAGPAAPAAPLVVSVEPMRIPTLGGNRVTIFGEGFAPGTTVLFGAFLGTQTVVLSEQELMVTAPAQAEGVVDVLVTSPNGLSTLVTDGFEYVSIANADAEIIRLLEQRFPGGPRIVSAVATSHTSVRLTMSEPVDAADALDQDNYSFAIPGGGKLILDPNVPIQINADQTVISLTTLGQADADYVLTLTGMRDLAGNRLAAPDILVNPAETMFQGIAPPDINDQRDIDGDGFADWFELLGWQIQIELANGTRIDSYVTSDPFNPDTDGDGLTDSEENARSLDPRTDDTDADRVSDWIETRDLLSDPADQDSDDDGLADETELNFKTSVTLADTDGDQLDDRSEIVLRNRNPRLADLPLPQILIGTMNIEIDERFTFTDEQGVEQSTERSSSVGFTQSDTTTFATSSTRSNEATNQFSQQIKVGGEGEIGKGKAGIKLGAEVQLGSSQSRGNGFSHSISEESSSTAQEEFSRGLSEALAISERNAVTRSVEAAKVNVDLTIVNAGNLAFTISNLEVSARVQDPQDRNTFLPMATLQPASGNNVFNLGPLDSQRGPIIFENTEIFPNLAQSLLREPRATIFEIANFDLEDELGRNFAFSQEEINDLTASIEIDFGDGTVESYRVATASTFTNQITNGITMREALVDIVGFVEEPNEPELPVDFDPTDPAIRDSFGTAEGSNGEQILARVRGVQTNFNTADPTAKFWVVLSNTDIDPNANFGDFVLKPRDSYLIWYVQDADDDDLFAREEFLYGSSDEAVDTDDDQISDFDEVRTGWLTAEPGNNRRVFSNPGLADSDRDQIDDNLERRLQSDPRLQDSDADGISDRVEIDGYQVTLLDDDNNPNNNPIITVTPYSDAAIIEPRSGGDGIASTVVDPNSDDEQLIDPNLPVLPGDVIIGPGPDGIIDSQPLGDEFRATTGPKIVATAVNTTPLTLADPNSDDVQLADPNLAVQPGDVLVGAGRDGVLQTVPVGSDRERVAHRAMFATDPVNRDTDGDSLSDGREQFLGSRPNIRDADSVIDSDNDGLTDKLEIEGWFVAGTNTLVTSDPMVADTDGDRLPDVYEFGLLSNPRNADTDNDGLGDYDEFDPADPRNFYNSDRLATVNLFCADAANCQFTPAVSPIGTNVVDRDTDDDGLADGIEVNGWIVRVVGEPIETVTSNPFNTNSDGDTLSDNAEYLGGDGRPPTAANDSGDATNPSLADTDNDGVIDSTELNQNSQGGFLAGSGRRNPLRPDQLLEIRMVEYEVVKTNDAGDDAEQRFEFFITPPGGGEVRVVSSITNPSALGLVDCDDDSTTPCFSFDNNCNGNIIEIDDGDRVIVPTNSTFVKRVVIADNQIVTIRGWFTEIDGDCEDSDEGFPLNRTRVLEGIQQGGVINEEFRLQNADVDVAIKYQVLKIES